MALSSAEVETELAKLRAFGKIMNVPPPVLDPILAETKARLLELGARPVPAGPPTP